LNLLRLNFVRRRYRDDHRWRSCFAGSTLQMAAAISRKRFSG